MQARFLIDTPSFVQGTDAEYFRLKAWNNSGLGNLYYHARGIPQPDSPTRAFHFGSAIHRMILEPQWWIPDDWKLTTAELRAVEGMANAATKDVFLTTTIQQSRREQICTWKDGETKLPCKIKVDALPPSEFMIDLKTTSASTRLEFLEACTKYEYDRQAVMYMDGAKRSRMIFIGIQKRAPYELYYYEVEPGKRFYEMGHKKYRKLLSIAAQHGYKYPQAIAGKAAMI